MLYNHNALDKEDIRQWTQGLATFNSGSATFNSGLATFNSGLATFNSGLATFNSGSATFTSGLATVNSVGLTTFNSGLATFNSGRHFQRISGALEEYRQKARDPVQSKALYRDMEGYQTFKSAPGLFDVPHALIRKEYEAAWRDMELGFVTGTRTFVYETGPVRYTAGPVRYTAGPARYAGTPTPDSRAPHAFAYSILGHPGIAGKTVFLSLALLRCLERHWTVVLQLGASRVYVFNSLGVFTASTSALDCPRLKSVLPRATWCLVDSTMGQMESVPELIAGADRFIVQAARPRVGCVRWMKKMNRFVSRYVMEAMPVEEAYLAYVLSEGGDRTTSSSHRIEAYFVKYGPCARGAFRAVGAGEESWEDDAKEVVETALHRLDLSSFREVVDRSSRMQGDVPDDLLLVGAGRRRDKVRVDVVSSHVFAQLLSALSRRGSEGDCVRPF
ncbi:hypothetical protein BD626DRAFT_392280 [Schizophyllum amplum]|uniref:Uncharacterized protein n=1 Tax=Schizophyllum amplum TaxID=97359 RepID=A0A550CZC6_9AGAR|nr:hypothetical protein BD626DRAFT_392280 [Auriculariopsis ampla]